MAALPRQDATELGADPLAGRREHVGWPSRLALGVVRLAVQEVEARDRAHLRVVVAPVLTVSRFAFYRFIVLPFCLLTILPLCLLVMFARFDRFGMAAASKKTLLCLLGAR